MPGFDAKLEREFLEFHLANPDVYTALLNYAVQLQARGRKRYGIGALFEVLRWHKAMTTTDPDFKLNNNHRAFYARLIMTRESALDGFFSVRRSVADDMA